MTVRKTIDIPPNREVYIKLVVPESVPCGKRDLILEFPQEPEVRTPPDTMAADDPDARYQKPLEPWLIGAVNPAIRGTIKTVGDIIGPFHDEWENGY